MSNLDFKEIAAAWHRRQDRFESVEGDFTRRPDEEDPDYDLAAELDRLLDIEGHADLAWEVINAIWATMDPGNPGRIELFAASLMEDLVRNHGPHVIDRLEVKAREDSIFRRMLRGMWPPRDESRPDWLRIVKLLEDLGPMQSFKGFKLP